MLLLQKNGMSCQYRIAGKLCLAERQIFSPEIIFVLIKCKTANLNDKFAATLHSYMHCFIDLLSYLILL